LPLLGKGETFVRKLKDENGNWIEGWDGLSGHINSYFCNLFNSKVEAPNDKVINKVKPCVSEAMNELLCAPYTREEVKKALFNIGPEGTGPDGLHAIFYKRYWSLLGEELIDEVLSAINLEIVPDDWNNTTVILIPKVENPEMVTHYRPISLCNIIYKVISKVLAERLKTILPEIISPNQSAFFPGRLITDNVLVAFESYHTIKKRKRENMALVQ
jgi:hypothetical protein